LPLWSTVLSLSTPILAEYYILYLHFMLHTSFCSSSLFFITIITKAVGITRRISIYLSLRRKLGSCSTTLLFGFLQQQKTSPAAFANGEVMLKYRFIHACIDMLLVLFLHPRYNIQCVRLMNPKRITVCDIDETRLDFVRKHYP